MNQPAAHAHITFDEVERVGDPERPLDFPSPFVAKAIRVNALVVHLESGVRQVCSGVIHREDLHGDASSSSSISSSSSSKPSSPSRAASRVVSYWPQRRLQDAIFGSVWACTVLQQHFGVAADDAARAAGVEPGSPGAPIVWEITGEFVAIKMVEWSRVHHMRGRLLEDPVKEVAAMQMLGTGHPNVLGSTEVLQDDDFLYSVMPYCSGGDLFGVVVQHAEENGGEIGMPEPVARYWFRQILWGLHHLQSLGICHRDLSLENVLVNEENCLIIDMGMCLRVPYKSKSGKITDVRNGTIRKLMRPQGVCGKHNYMSPEVYADRDAFDGFAIDLWAAGVILYIMLTGFPPYDQASRTDQRFDLIINGRLMDQLRNWEIHISEEAGDLMQSMLRLHPRDRLTLAEVMAHPWVASGHAEPPLPPEPMPYH